MTTIATTEYRNFLSGTLSSGITNVATSISSAGFASLPSIAAPFYMWIVLDPAATAGNPEVVKVTAHTAASTTVTVVRAQQDTGNRTHAGGIAWTHDVTATDLQDFASGLNTLWNTPAINRQGAWVYRTTSQSFTSGVDTQVTFNAERFDSGAWFSSTTIVPDDGFGGSVPGIYVAQIRVFTNGATGYIGRAKLDGGGLSETIQYLPLTIGSDGYCTGMAFFTDPTQMSASLKLTSTLNCLVELSFFLIGA